MGRAESNPSVTGLGGFTQMLSIFLVPLRHECFLCEISLPNCATEHPANAHYIPGAPAVGTVSLKPLLCPRMACLAGRPIADRPAIAHSLPTHMWRELTAWLKLTYMPGYDDD